MPKNGNRRGPAPLWASQNYLTGSATIRRILRLAWLSKADTVLEIGPGRGHITRQLLPLCRRVIAVELDGGNAAHLRAAFQEASNLTLIHRDFLTWPLPASGCWKVFSNIPFALTTQILRRLTEAPNPPEDLWLVVEKGAAKRFLGRPRENLRSLLLKPHYEGEITYHFRREDFHPAPGVDAVLLHLHRREVPHLKREQRSHYEAFVSAGLQTGGLRRLFTPRQLKAALREAGLPRDFLLGEVRYVQWLCLFRCYWTHVLKK